MKTKQKQNEKVKKKKKNEGCHEYLAKNTIVRA